MATVTGTPAEDLLATLSDPDALYEIVDGRVIEVQAMGAFAAKIAQRIERALDRHTTPRRLGFTAVETIFVLDPARNLRRRPDVAFVSSERWPPDRTLPAEGDFEVVPDLAIEVISPHDRGGAIASKTREYLRCGVRQVWLVLPETREVVVYRSPKNIEVFEEGDDLTSEDLLPGLRVPLIALFSSAID